MIRVKVGRLLFGVWTGLNQPHETVSCVAAPAWCHYMLLGLMPKGFTQACSRQGQQGHSQQTHGLRGCVQTMSSHSQKLTALLRRHPFRQGHQVVIR